MKAGSSVTLPFQGSLPSQLRLVLGSPQSPRVVWGTDPAWPFYHEMIHLRVTRQHNAAWCFPSNHAAQPSNRAG